MKVPEPPDRPFHKRSHGTFIVTSPYISENRNFHGSAARSVLSCSASFRIRGQAASGGRSGRPGASSTSSPLPSETPTPGRPTTARSTRFMDWCERRGLHGLGDVMPIHVAAYVEQLPLSRASVRQHLSAISRCFDWLVSGGVLQSNPATSVQRPRHVVRVRKTPALSDE